jgi:hypothetical protein
MDKEVERSLAMEMEGRSVSSLELAFGDFPAAEGLYLNQWPYYKNGTLISLDDTPHVVEENYIVNLLFILNMYHPRIISQMRK